MRLAQLPRLPSEIWNLREQGYSDHECLQFDRAHLAFWDFFEQKKSEEVWQTSPKTPKGKSPVPKYKTDREIIELYYPDRDPALTDPVADAITDDQLASIMDDLFADDMDIGDHDERAGPDAAG